MEAALAELVGRGLVSSDGFAGLRLLLAPVDTRRRGHHKAPLGMEAPGRWSTVSEYQAPDDDATEAIARILLRRYGIVCRRVLARETGLPPWYMLVRTYWRLEARGEVLGGRFVAGVPGEHFGLPEAVGLLRTAGSSKELGAEPVSLSAADPLNLEGIMTPGPRIPAVGSNRLLLKNGLVVATAIGKEVRIESGHGEASVLKRILLKQPGVPMRQRVRQAETSGAERRRAAV